MPAGLTHFLRIRKPEPAEQVGCLAQVSSGGSEAIAKLHPEDLTGAEGCPSKSLHVMVGRPHLCPWEGLLGTASPRMRETTDRVKGRGEREGGRKRGRGIHFDKGCYFK